MTSNIHASILNKKIGIGTPGTFVGMLENDSVLASTDAKLEIDSSTSSILPTDHSDEFSVFSITFPKVNIFVVGILAVNTMKSQRLLRSATGARANGYALQLH